MNRRHCLRLGASATLLSALGLPALAQSSSKSTKVATASPSAPSVGGPAMPALKIYIPGGEGGGWDQTGRALGAAIQAAGLVQRVEYENKGGKGGTIGLADFVERYSRDPQALLMGGMVMVGALAVNKPAVGLDRVTPVARLTSDYMVLAVPGGAKSTDLKSVIAQLQKDPASVVFTGGSVGGVDHMLAGMIARQLRVDPAQLRYLPTSSGREAVDLLEAGKAQVAISSYSEFKPEIEKKAVTPIASSSRKALYGVPSLTEQGVQTELANWRGVFAPKDISAAQQESLRRIVIRATESQAWKQALLDNSWLGAMLYGREFQDTLELEQGIAATVTMMLKLKA